MTTPASTAILGEEISPAGGTPQIAKGQPTRLGVSVKVLTMAVMTLLLLAACGGGGSGGEPTTETPPASIAGRAMVGPLQGGTVTAYELNADGSNGRSLGTTTTDSTGGFRIVLSSPAAGPVRVVVSGGSYANLANASISVVGVPLSAILPSVGSGGISGLAITPLTSFADRRSSALIAAGTPFATALSQADSAIRLAYGIQDASLPLFNLLPNYTLAGGDAAVLALLLGAFDQLAILQGRTPAEIYRAVSEDITDGQLDGRSTSGPVLFGDAAPVPSTLATASFLSALAAYIAPSNTTTAIALNRLTLSPATLSAVQGGVATQLRSTWTQGGNNSALLSGDSIGTGLATVATLRKRIGVNIGVPNSSLVFGDAYASRSSASSDAAYILLPVTNVGSKTLCFVKLANLGYRTAAGSALASGGLTFVQGSVRKLAATSISTDTCLGPAESGLVADIRSGVNFTSVASMEFSVEVTETGILEAAARVIPQSYSVRASTAGAQTATVVLRNTGSGSASLGSLNHKWVLFDDSMVPLHWGYASDAVSPRTPLVAGATGSISANLVFYAGSGRRLLVFVDFDDGSSAGPTGDVVCEAVEPREERDACKLAARTRRLSTQFMEAGRAQAAAAYGESDAATDLLKGY